MALGYRGNADWRDMSEFAVHFTKGTDDNAAIDVLEHILDSKHLMASGPFGAARTLWMLGDSQKSVCFSEIPLDLLIRLTNTRSCYGLGFSQDFLVERGGARVWYLDNEGAVAAAFKAVKDSKISQGIDENDPFWKLTPLVDFPGDYGFTQFEFEWEREWRHPGSMTFSSDDLSFIFAPETHHSNLRQRFTDIKCPLIDPLWAMPRLQEGLKDLPPDEPAEKEDLMTMCMNCGGPVWQRQCQMCGESG